MTPVISPWLFYLMSTVDGLRGFIVDAFLVTCALGIALSIYWVIVASDANIKKDIWGEGHQSYINCKVKLDKCVKFLKSILIWFCVLGVMKSVIPSSNTITKMIIAQNVTYERVEAATDTVETVYNDIMALFEDNNSEGETE